MTMGLHTLEIGFTDEHGDVLASVEGQTFKLPQQGAQCALHVFATLYAANAATYRNAMQAADEESHAAELALYAIAASAFAQRNPP